MSHDEAPPDLLARIRQDDAAELTKVKATLLPQRVGMAIAARMLADDISWYMLGRLERLRAEDAIAHRLGGDADDAPALVQAVLTLLEEELTHVLDRIRVRSTEWLHAAMRAEGMVQALEARTKRLDELAAPPPPQQQQPEEA